MSLTPSSSGELEKVRRCTALVLDGGGVRGLSSLLILQKLMLYINNALQAKGYRGSEVFPYDIFSFAAGTSTGGLIAIMLARLRLSVDDCISKYRKFSKRIFGKKRRAGKYTGGLVRPRYRARALRECVQEILKESGLPDNEPLFWGSEGSDLKRMQCAVVCRQHENRHRYSPVLPDAVHLCSIPCEHKFDFSLVDAARATSAAWTYFPLQRIGNYYFCDGGVEFNNPSQTIWVHYTQERAARDTRERYFTSKDKAKNEPKITHAGVNFSHCRIVNIGTGSFRSNVTPRRERDRFASLLPDFVLQGRFLKKTLTKIATDSEKPAAFMDQQVEVRQGKLEFTRLSATNGVCYIKMDAHRDLEKIKELTYEWLEKEDVVETMQALAEDMADDYLEVHPVPTAARDIESALSGMEQSDTVPALEQAQAEIPAPKQDADHLLPPNQRADNLSVPSLTDGSEAESSSTPGKSSRIHVQETPAVIAALGELDQPTSPFPRQQA